MSAQTFKVIEMPPPPKAKKEKKPVPVIRMRKRRARKSEVIREKKVIREDSQEHFVIQFPEELQEKLGPLVMEIPGMFKPAVGYRIPYNPDGTIPEDELTFLCVYKVRISEETLQAVARFGKSHRFFFDSDIPLRAQMSSSDGKELEKMSYAKNATLVLPYKLPIDPSTNKPYELKKFQAAGIQYTLRAKRTFIADEMGLGKTIEGIGTIICSQKFPWLIVVPSSLRINWYKECRKWIPKRYKVAMIRNKDIVTRKVRNKKTGAIREVQTIATQEFLDNNHVFIMTYDKIHRYGEILEQKEWAGIIFDESHYLKGRSAKRGRRIRSFVKEISPEYILMLSGTPLMNKPTDLLPQLQIMDRINDFGGYNHFLVRYCSLSTTDQSHVSAVHKKARKGVVEEASEENDNTETIDLTQMNTTGAQDLDEEMKDAATRKLYENMTALNKSLRSICYVRREKEDVLKELPEKSRQTLTFEITNRKMYESIEADVIGYLADQAAKDEKFLKSIKRLSKETQKIKIAEQRASKAYAAARAEVLVRINALKQCAAVGKLKATKEWIDNFLQSGKKLVVFAHHNIILNELEATYPDAVSIRSNMSPERRDEAVTEFQTNKKCRLIIVGLKLAVGLTLTAAADTLTCEFGWTPAAHDQAEDRVHRIGQKKAVTAYYAVAQKTIEENIGRLIEEKRRVVNAVADGDPLKGATTGSILGSLLGELTGKMGLYR